MTGAVDDRQEQWHRLTCKMVLLSLADPERAAEPDGRLGFREVIAMFADPKPPTAFDIHRELVRTRQEAEWNNLLVAGISDTLSSIHDEIAQVRRANAEALAIQQELLNREVIQGRLEEFIYQIEKMVTEFEGPDCEAVPSTRYFLLTGVLKTIQTEGISTAVIRGRDNKATFEAVVRRARTVAKTLEGDPEVREALAWAAQERKRLADKKAAEEEEQRQREQEEQKRRREREAERAKQRKADRVRLAELQAKLADLNRQGGRLPFGEWYSKSFRWAIDLGSPASLLVQGLLWLAYGFVWIPCWYAVHVMTAGGKMPPDLQAEIGTVKEEIRKLEAGLQSR